MFDLVADYFLFISEKVVDHRLCLSCFFYVLWLILSSGGEMLQKVVSPVLNPFFFFFLYFLPPGFFLQVAPAEGFSDLAMQVMTSPSKNYILTVIGTGVALLFLVGMFCGRFTKRVTQELKDR